MAHSDSSKKPAFSAGLVTILLTLVFIVVFGATIMHGQEGIHQHDNVASSQTK